MNSQAGKQKNKIQNQAYCVHIRPFRFPCVRTKVELIFHLSPKVRFFCSIKEISLTVGDAIKTWSHTLSWKCAFVSKQMLWFGGDSYLFLHVFFPQNICVIVEMNGKSAIALNLINLCLSQSNFKKLAIFVCGFSLNLPGSAAHMCKTKTIHTLLSRIKIVFCRSVQTPFRWHQSLIKEKKLYKFSAWCEKRAVQCTEANGKFFIHLYLSPYAASALAELSFAYLRSTHRSCHLFRYHTQRYSICLRM